MRRHSYISEPTHCFSNAPTLTNPTLAEVSLADQYIFDFSHETKVCTDCKQRKPISQFNKKHGKPRWHCKECHRASVKLFNRIQYGKNKDYYYWQNMKKLYGLTPETWQKIYDSQNGLCALCKKPGRSGMRFNRLNVDHCHSTGRVRGFLCINCNTALGILGDTPKKMQEVVRYLEGSVHIGRPPRPKKPRKKRAVITQPWGIPSIRPLQ